MKIKMLRKLLMLMALLCLAAAPSPVNAKGWEALKVEKAQTQRVASNSEIEIKAVRGMIYVNTTRQINIKIFTILGSRIADDTLAPGSYQFPVPAHGVYIIKAGDLTCKVAV